MDAKAYPAVVGVEQQTADDAAALARLIADIRREQDRRTPRRADRITRRALRRWRASPARLRILGAAS